MWSLIIQESNLNVAVKDTVLKEMLSNEAKLKSYLLGEDKPEEVIDFAVDSGLFITIHVPTKLTSWKSFLRDRSDRIEFRVYRYLNGSVDEAELVYEELGITTPEPEIHHKCEIYLLPGRYYFRLTGCESAFCESSAFCPEHEFIAFNASEPFEGKLPKWTETPNSPLWFSIYDLEFNILLESLYLGFQKNMFEDVNLLEGAFYHCPDGEGVLRTFIFDGTSQIFEGFRL
jgi:hypothetical protein